VPGLRGARRLRGRGRVRGGRSGAAAAAPAEAPLTATSDADGAGWDDGDARARPAGGTEFYGDAWSRAQAGDDAAALEADGEACGCPPGESCRECVGAP
jgi:hypothetical protein